ncbi:MAG TPA: DHH family phosphoesterase [Nitrososphaeraceae archaeon]|jgi:RecJ-like exonuclease|nr:DHH family phosphoesterase [Nitrososphaeraceae archaeon]
MSDKEIYQALKAFCEKIEYMVENEKEISIISHLDADGIASGSIISSALARLGAKCTIRTVSDMTLNVLEQMRYENHDFYIITDLGGGMANEFNQALDNRWVIIDHHQIPEHEISIVDNNQILNAWKYGIDGGKEISAGGMAYMVATTLDRKNKNLSPIAIVSALADRQDQGEKKSLFGLNSEIVKTAQSLRLISMDLDLMFTGRETRPIHEALAYTAFPYIEGLTWATESCYAVIKNAGIKMSNNGRWRVLSEISQDEKNIILNAIAEYVVNSSKNKEVNIIDNLIGYTYTLINEDQRSLLRDAREFSTMLNACGRIRKAGVGIGICMGDRNDLLNEGEKIVTKYRTTLRNYISSIFVEKWRMIDNGKSIFINGEGLLAEDMLGAISSLLSGSPTLGGRLVFVRTLTNDGFYKFSSRKSLGSTSKSDLGLIMRYCSESVGGSGGGHSSAAGCRIPSARLEEFLSAVRNAILDAKFTAAS